MRWRMWDGVRVTNEQADKLAEHALASVRKGAESSHCMTGDSVVVATKNGDGTIELLDCLVRRTSQVPEEP